MHFYGGHLLTWSVPPICIYDISKTNTFIQAVTSKKSALAHEFHSFQHLTSSIPWCKQYLWNSSSPSTSLTLQNWTQIDAWFRSRVLELPGIGLCLIPYLDMVNHSDNAANAYYSLNSDGDIDLLSIDPDNGLLSVKEITEVLIK